MPWGEVELEPEVAEWIEGLAPADFGRAETYIDLLAERGPFLDQPYTRQLRGKLRELRFRLGVTGAQVRITYFIASRRKIVLLTIFTKRRRRERSEIDRARRAMERCIAEGHSLKDG